MDYFLAHNLFWWDYKEQLALIVKSLLENVLNLAGCSVYHGDIKPTNIHLQNIGLKQEIRFGGIRSCTVSHKETKFFTPAYWPPYQLPPASKEERLKAELF